MRKRCPPGVVCIENVTTVVLFLCVLCAILVYKYGGYGKVVYVKETTIQPSINEMGRNFGLPTFNDIPTVLTNPHMAPLRDNHYHPRGSSDVRGVPVNIPTQSVDSVFRQVGILTRKIGVPGENILPLMGRPLFIRRDKWNFYTMNDKNNMIKLPIIYKNTNGMNEYGCDNIYDGDSVYVEGYQETFRATIYENNTLRYIPG